MSTVEETPYAVVVGGLDITARISPFLIDLSVEDKAGTVSDRASFTLDDAGGLIAMPSPRTPVIVMLDGAIVFEGMVDDVRSHGSRGAGRTLSVEAKGFDTGGKAKEPREKHWDDKTLGDVMNEAAGDAGLSGMAVHQSLASIHRDFFAMDGESLLAFGRRLAREVGATFKIVGNRGVMVPRSSGLSASGKPLVPILAAVGSNLISWDLAPQLPRPGFGAVTGRWFDFAAARWRSKQASAGEGDAGQALAEPAADEDTAGRGAGSEATETQRDKGEGSVVIDGNALAAAEAPCIVTGARAGVDGAWKIDGVTHALSRGNGFQTTLSLVAPDAG